MQGLNCRKKKKLEKCSGSFFSYTFLLTKQPRKIAESRKIRLNAIKKYKKLREKVVSNTGLRVEIMVMF